MNFINDFIPVIIPNEDESFVTLQKNQVPRKFRYAQDKQVLTYQIEWLVSYGFQKIYVVCDVSLETDVRNCIKGYENIIELNVFEIIKGSADALSAIKDKLTKDLIVLSGSIILEVDLINLIDDYRVSDGLITIVLQEIDIDIKQRNKSNDIMVYGLYQDSKLLLADTLFQGENIRIPKVLLSKYPNYSLRTDLKDPSMYIITKHAMKYIAEPEIKRIALDLLPKLLSSQHYINDDPIMKTIVEEKKKEMLFDHEVNLCNAYIVKKHTTNQK
ncbi:hypothetical protein WA158_006060 [Blastocystis sp. Blastoise]